MSARSALSFERRERERLETRDKILDAAREMFAQAGYEAVTMRAIADRIGYTPTAIYHHFKNKQELVTELCHADFRGLAGHFLRAVHIADPVERIQQIGEAYLEFAERHPNHYRFMFMTEVPEIEHSPEYRAEHFGNPESDAYAFLRKNVQDAIDRSAFRPEFSDADQIAQILWATLHGLISIHVVKHHHDWVELRDLRQTARVATETLFRGMLKEVPARVAETR